MKNSLIFCPFFMVVVLLLSSCEKDKSDMRYLDWDEATLIANHWVSSEGVMCPLQVTKKVIPILRGDGVVIGGKPQITFLEENVVIDSIVVGSMLNNGDTLYWQLSLARCYINWTTVGGTRLYHFMVPLSPSLYSEKTESFLVFKKKVIKLPSPYFTSARENGEYVELIFKGEVVYTLNL